MSIVSQKKLESSLDLLGVKSNHNWQDVQAKYRTLVQKWHPDRHAGEDSDIAQSKFIELNTAFKMIRDHYRKSGTLPMQTSVELDGPLLGDKQGQAKHNPFWTKKRMLFAMAGVGLLTIVTIVMLSLDSRLAENNRNKATIEKVTSKAITEPERTERSEAIKQSSLLVP